MNTKTKQKTRRPNLSLLANRVKYWANRVYAGEAVTVEVLETVALELLSFANQINDIAQLAKEPIKPEAIVPIAPIAAIKTVQAQQPQPFPAPLYNGYKLTSLPPAPIKHGRRKRVKHG